MLRKFVCALFALVVCVGVSLADELKAKVKSVDADKNTVTVTADGKDMTFKVNDSTKILNAQDKDVKARLKAPAFKEGANVTITYDKGKDTATQIKLGGKDK